MTRAVNPYQVGSRDYHVTRCALEIVGRALGLMDELVSAHGRTGSEADAIIADALDRAIVELRIARIRGRTANDWQAGFARPPGEQ